MNISFPSSSDTFFFSFHQFFLKKKKKLMGELEKKMSEKSGKVVSVRLKPKSQSKRQKQKK